MKIIQSGSIIVTAENTSIEIPPILYNVNFITEEESDSIEILLGKDEDKKEWVKGKEFKLEYGVYKYKAYRENYGRIEKEITIDRSKDIEVDIENNLMKLNINIESLPELTKPNENIDLKIFDISDNNNLIYVVEDIKGKNKISINDVDLNKEYRLELYVEDLFEHGFNVYSTKDNSTITSNKDIEEYNIIFNLSEKETYYKFLYYLISYDEEEMEFIEKVLSSEFYYNGIRYKPIELDKGLKLCALYNKYNNLVYPLLRSGDNIKIDMEYHRLGYEEESRSYNYMVDMNTKIHYLYFETEEYYIEFDLLVSDVDIYWKLSSEAEDMWKVLEKDTLFRDGVYDFKITKYGYEDKYINNHNLTFHNRTINALSMVKQSCQVIITLPDKMNMKTTIPTNKILITVYEDDDVSIYQKELNISDMNANTITLYDFPKGIGLYLFLEILFYKDQDNLYTDTLDNILEDNLDNLYIDNIPIKYTIDRYVNVEENQTEIDLTRSTIVYSSPICGRIYYLNSLINFTENDFNNIEIYMNDKKDKPIKYKGLYKDGYMKFILLNDDDSIMYFTYGNTEWRPRFKLTINHKKPYFKNTNRIYNYKKKAKYNEIELRQKRPKLKLIGYENNMEIHYKRKSETDYILYDLKNEVLNYEIYDIVIVKPNGSRLTREVNLTLTDNFNNIVNIV